MMYEPPANRMVNVNQPSGWLCPVCGKANAPHVTACNHAPLVMVNAGICFLGDDPEPVKSGHVNVVMKRG